VAAPSTSSPPPPSASERAFEPAPTAFADAGAARDALANPTWDPNATVKVGGKDKQGAWVDATAARGAAGDKRMVAGATLDPAKANAKLADGTITHEELGAITADQVAQINPLGEAPRRILKTALHESWHDAKHALLAAGDNAPARQMLMTKLWEFRQWHHTMILQRTQDDPSIGKEGLSDWKVAGSTTLTSDIDVNLKGKKTEAAVAVFNRKFREDGWAHEPGVVYDVNVYAVDFMHNATFSGLADVGGDIEPHAFTPGDTATRVSAKEGAREGSLGGGVGTKNPMLDKRMVAADADLQRVWSLVKMRLYMSGAQWAEYVKDADVTAATQAQVNVRYDSYMAELRARMLAGEHLVVAADETKLTGFAVIDKIARAKGAASGQDGENVKMAASNRLYEDKLVQMSTLRTRVQAQIETRKAWLTAGKHGDAEALDAAIDGNLAILRDLVSECSLFANEGYLTDGGINHVVVGMQSKVEITQTRSESLDAFNENVADSLKEIARHSGSVGEAAYKAGKYLWRMADAARNLGVTDYDLKALYAAGYTIANEIKGGDDDQVAAEAKAAKALQDRLGGKAATPDALMAYVRQTAAAVAWETNETAAMGQKRAAPVKQK
jgi:hypothetical protein